ncbi:MAG: hypothetical protein KDC06_12185, partial [Chitinophagaceae bacterium]|nr:hypothetical protein [Chitinophagaceae bacterium]
MKKITLILVFALSANLFFTNQGFAQNNAPIGCNGQYYVSHGPSSGNNGQTKLDKLAFSGSTLSASSFALNTDQYGFNAIGLNPIDGYIYAIRYPAFFGSPELIKIGNGGTNVTNLGSFNGDGLGNTSYAACFGNDGTFYFVDNGGFFGSGRLKKITNGNLASRNVQNVGSTNSAYNTIYDIAINPVDGQMYGTNSSTGSNFLVTINKATGAISAPYGADMGGSDFIAGLFFDETGELYGYRADGGFYQINKTTGVLTPAGSGASYSGADGCSCTFGRVYHDLDFTANPSNQICP